MKRVKRMASDILYGVTPLMAKPKYKHLNFIQLSTNEQLKLNFALKKERGWSTRFAIGNYIWSK